MKFMFGSGALDVVIWLFWHSPYTHARYVGVSVRAGRHLLSARGVVSDEAKSDGRSYEFATEHHRDWPVRIS